jgi:hypothetical protein
MSSSSSIAGARLFRLLVPPYAIRLSEIFDFTHTPRPEILSLRKMPRSSQRLANARAQRTKLAAAGEHKASVPVRLAQPAASAAAPVLGLASAARAVIAAAPASNKSPADCGRTPMLWLATLIEKTDYPDAEKALADILGCERAVAIFDVCYTDGGRSDVFFTIANEDVPRAALMRLMAEDIKWYSDCNQALYPKKFIKRFESSAPQQ